MPDGPQHSDATTAVGETPETPAKLTREDVAKLEIGRTDMPRWLAVALTVAFVALIFAVPVSQVFYHRLRGEPLQMLDIAVKAPPRVAETWQRTDGGFFDRLFAANAEALKQINNYEDALEDASWMTHAMLGPVQQCLLDHFGAGNEEAYLGRDGWLFYRLDVDHVMGVGFLDEDQLKRRRESGNEYTDPPQPDPRLAILQFREQLAHRGIELVLMPTPVKPTIHPEQFTARAVGRDAPLHNASYPKFVEQMRDAGVRIFDPHQLLMNRAATGQPQFLATDTHWTPGGMQAVASALATYLETQVNLPLADADFRASMRDVRNLGDIAAMLELPEDQKLFQPQEVVIRRITDADSNDWQPSRKSNVLLLGDSFTNIYAMADLGWGTSAGFAEQLSYELGQSIDRIAINAGGAHAARRSLVNDLARGNDRLQHTRVVVWQFAMRELSSGDWKLMDLPEANARDDGPMPLPEGAVRATIAARTEPPRPGTVPYRDAVISLHLTNIQGHNAPEQLLAYTFGMRDNKLVDQPWAVGRTVTVKLTPWSEAQGEYGTYNRFEFDDLDLIMLDAYWVQLIE